MLLDYKVLKGGHIHNDKELGVGEIVSLPTSTAERYPETFQCVDAKTTSRSRGGGLSNSTED